MAERWASVAGYEGYYEVSDLGNIRSLPRVVVCADGRVRNYPGRVINPWVSNGYLMVGLSRGGFVRTQYVHLLVAAAFLPPKPEGMEVNHQDGNRANARADNLEWNTHQQNCLHGIDTGLRKTVGGACVTKLTDADVEDIRSGGTVIEKANKYGITEWYVRLLRSGKRRRNAHRTLS